MLDTVLLFFADGLLFFPAFLTGLCLAGFLALLGCYLRLRRETLAALAYAQAGAAGTLAAMSLEMPLVLGGLATALGAAGVKQVGIRRPVWGTQPGTLYALLLLFAWAVGVLLTSNLPLAERLGRALFDGQLLLSGGEALVWVVPACILGMLLLQRASKALLLIQLFPDMARLQPRYVRISARLFDAIAALGIGMATLSLGVMAVFALILIPAWIAFTRQRSWRVALWSSVRMALLVYGFAFASALGLDQPFGPILVMALLLLGLVVRKAPVA